MKEWVRPLQFLLTVGWYVALSLVIPVAIGLWLDNRWGNSPLNWNSSPLFTFIGLGLGTVIAFYGLFRMLRQYEAEERTRQKGKRSQE